MPVRKKILIQALHVIPLVIFNYIVGILSYFVLVPWFVVNVVYRFVTGGPQIPGGNLLLGVLKWQFSNTKYVVFGKGSFRWIPPMQ